MKDLTHNTSPAEKSTKLRDLQSLSRNVVHNATDPNNSPAMFLNKEQVNLEAESRLTNSISHVNIIYPALRVGQKQ